MKLESRVIVDHYATVKVYIFYKLGYTCLRLIPLVGRQLGLFKLYCAHIARQTLVLEVI